MLNSHQANFFKVTKNEENIQHSKRLCEDTPPTPSEILEEAAATLVQEIVNISPNLLTTQDHNEKTATIQQSS